jgi:two-component system phosphate regulon sensor histidine kinase PhoR
MPETWRRFLTGLLLLLAGGTLLGWFYGHPVWGLLAATVVALGWQVRHLLKFEHALRTRNFEYLRTGEGIWSQIFARFSHLRQRSRKHKRSYQRLLREVRDSTNAMPDGAIVMNASFEIVLCNAAAQDLAGFDARLDRGQRVDNILRDPVFSRYLKSADYSSGIEIRSSIREGDWLHCRAVPYGADQHLLLIRDITERKRLTQMRREFVANASHELRSPLTVISGYLDTLAEDPEAPQHWRKPLAQMRAQAIRMNRIVAELLELSRLESTATVTVEQQIDVPALIESVVRLESENPAAPSIRVEATSRARLRGSGAEIESVVRNLLSNAIRHTPVDGSIVLEWTSGGQGAELVVEDTGEGIPEELIPRVTERFFRIDQGRSREGGGIGLGLAIVKHVLGRHDATLEIESQPGKGSRFICRFPAARLVKAAPVPLVPDRHSA